nr:hypothetical protein [Ktedonobacteraceae bacterium]
MAGTMIGGQHTCDTNYERYGRDYYHKLGARGGTRSRTGGFWYKKHVLGDIESIRNAGRLGGRISRRGPNKLAEKRRREIRKAYEELLGIHEQAKRERATYTQTRVPRLDDGAVTVFDRKRGLVREQVA